MRRAGDRSRALGNLAARASRCRPGRHHPRSRPVTPTAPAAGGRRRLPAGVPEPDLRQRHDTGHPARRVPEALVALSARAGLPLWIPDDVAGHCCGVPWSSKGYADGPGRDGRADARQRCGAGATAGELPVVIDASSCTLGVVSELALDGVEVLDSVALGPRPSARPSGASAAGCRASPSIPPAPAPQLGLSGKLAAIARGWPTMWWCPPAHGCCGMAGDRGWLHPELPAVGAARGHGGGARRPSRSTPTSRATGPASWPCGRSPGAPTRSFVLIARGADARMTVDRRRSASAAGRAVRPLPPPADRAQHPRLGVLAVPSLAGRARALPALPTPAGAPRARATSPGTAYDGGSGSRTMRLEPSWACWSCSENRPLAGDLVDQAGLGRLRHLGHRAAGTARAASRSAAG